MKQLLDALGSAGFIVTPSMEFDLLPHGQVPLGFSSLVLVYFYFTRVYIALGQWQSRAEQLGCVLKRSKVTWWGRGWVRARSVLPGASCCCSLACPQEGKENAQAFQPPSKRFHLPGFPTRMCKNTQKTFAGNTEELGRHRGPSVHLADGPCLPRKGPEIEWGS